MTRRPPPPPWPRATEAALIIGFWAVLGALALVRRNLDPRGPIASGSGGLVVTLMEYGVWAAVTPAVFAIARRLRFESGARLRHGLMVVVATLIGAVLVEWVRQTLFFSFFPEDIVFRRGRRGPGPPPGPSLDSIVLRLRFLDEVVIWVAVFAAGFARDALIRLRAREADALARARRAVGG